MSSTTLTPTPVYIHNSSSDGDGDGEKVRTPGTKNVRLWLVSTGAANNNDDDTQSAMGIQPPRLEKGRSTSTSSADTARTSIMTEEDIEEQVAEEPLLDDDYPLDEEKENPLAPKVSSTREKNRDQPSSSNTLKHSTESKSSASVKENVVRLSTKKVSPNSAAPAARSAAVRPPPAVRFGNLSVHEFPCALGDHPAVRGGGPPIRLEYHGTHETEEKSTSTTTNKETTTTTTAANPVYSYTVPVEDYEFSRPQRRTLPELLVPADTRREWLLQEGRWAASDLARAERGVKRVQKQRHVSTLLQELEEWQLAHEAVRRWWHRRRLKTTTTAAGRSSSSSSSGGDCSSQWSDNAAAAHEWCRQHKEQKLAERREQRLRKIASATF